MARTKTIQIEEAVYRTLTMLKLAWDLPTYSDVIRRTTEPYQGEKFKVLDIPVVLDQ